jgi:hypothetical protein
MQYGSQRRVCPSTGAGHQRMAAEPTASLQSIWHLDSQAGCAPVPTNAFLCCAKAINSADRPASVTSQDRSHTMR